MKSYPTKKLGDCLIQFDRGISWSRKNEGGTTAVLRIPNIQEGHINVDNLKYINAKNGNGKLDKNDIVMVASNGNPDLVGRSALVTEEEKGMRFASFLIRLRLDNTKLLSQYAHLFLLTPIFKRELRRKIATTSGIYNLKKEHIEKIKIPLPPLSIQKQIVERLDKIAEAQKLNDELIQKSDELFQSLLHQELNPAGPADAKAMAGKKDWEVKNIGEVCKIVGGGTPSREELKHFKGDIPWVTVKDLNVLEIEDTLEHINKESLKNSAANLVPAGTVLVVTRVGLGKMAIAKKSLTFNQDIKGLIANAEIDPSYLFYAVLNKTDKIIRNGKGATVKGITQEFLKSIKIFFPPLETQKQIVAKLSAVQEYKTQLLAQKAKLKELFNSALARSMNSGQANANVAEFNKLKGLSRYFLKD